MAEHSQQNEKSTAGGGIGFIDGMLSRYLPGLPVNLGWAGFLSMFQGWLAAWRTFNSGSTNGIQHRSRPERKAQKL